MLLETRNVPIFFGTYGGDASFGVSYIWILLPNIDRILMSLSMFIDCCKYFHDVKLCVID